MSEDIANAIIRLLNSGADPQDVRILTDAIPGAEFIPVEDVQKSQAVH